MGDGTSVRGQGASRKAAAGTAVAALALAAGWAAKFATEDSAEPDSGPATVDPPRRTKRLPRARARSAEDAAAAAQEDLDALGRSAAELEAELERLRAAGAAMAAEDGGTVVGDRRNGPFAETFPDGRPKRRGAFRNGKRHGLWVEWTEDGGRSEAEWEDGRRHGREAAWRKDGTPRFAGTYERDRKSGTWTSWHANGSVHSTLEFVDGELHGVARTYHANGTVETESIYANGKDTAPTQGWHPNGTLAFVMPYAEGKRQGEAVWYHDNGRVSARGTYVDGELEGEYRAWTEDGEEKPVERWRKGARLRAEATADGAPGEEGR